MTSLNLAIAFQRHPDLPVPHSSNPLGNIFGDPLNHPLPSVLQLPERFRPIVEGHRNGIVSGSGVLVAHESVVEADRGDRDLLNWIHPLDRPVLVVL